MCVQNYFLTSYLDDDSSCGRYEEVFIRHAPWERSRRVPEEFDVFGKGLKSYDECGIPPPTPHNIDTLLHPSARTWSPSTV